MHWVDWDRLVAFIRSRYPKPTKYGGDSGGKPEPILKLLRDDAELERISKALWEIDVQFDAETQKHYNAISDAGKRRGSALQALLDTLPKSR